MSLCFNRNGSTFFAGDAQGAVHAVSVVDGNLLWSYPTGGSVLSSPAISPDGTLIFVGSADSYLHAISTTTGVRSWRYPTAGSVHSSPIVSLDGTTVFVGSADNSLHAVTISSGQQAWAFPTKGAVVSSPALSPSGSVVYVGSDDSNLYAVDSQNGTIVWSFATGQAVYSSPALSPDGAAVFVGSWDGNFYAVDATNGAPLWNFTTGNAVYSSPAVATNGSAVFFGSWDYFLYKLDAVTGAIKWRFDTGNAVYSSPVLSRDGSSVFVASYDTFYAVDAARGLLLWSYPIGSAVKWSAAISPDGVVHAAGSNGGMHPAGGVHQFGLTESYALRTMHLALMAATRNDTVGELALLDRLCLDGSGSTLTPDVLGLTETACQAAQNSRSGAGWGGAWKGFVDPLAYTVYKQRIDPGSGDLFALLTKYEQHEQQFLNELENIEDMKLLAEAASKAVTDPGGDISNWEHRLQNSEDVLHSYGDSIVQVETLMQQSFDKMQTDLEQMMTSLIAHFKDLTAQLKKAKEEAEAKAIFGFLKGLFDLFKGVAAIVSGNANPGSFKDLYDGWKEAKAAADAFKNCDPCKKIQSELNAVQQQEKDVTAFVQLVNSTEALNEQISNHSAPLPKELPMIETDLLSLDSLGAWLAAFQSEMKLTSAASADVNMWVSYSKHHCGLLSAWYLTAIEVQAEQGQITALQLRANLTEEVLKTEAAEEAFLARAAALISEQRQKQAALVIKYFMEERKQFSYYALAPAPALTFSDDPTSEELQVQMVALNTAIQEEQEAQRILIKGWDHVTVSEKDDPSAFVRLRNATTGSGTQLYQTTLDLPMPYDYNNSVPLTDYYNVRFEDMRAYLMPPANATQGGEVQVYIVKTGTSFFLDKNLELQVFSHPPVDRGQFIYDSGTMCPSAGEACGSLCNDFVNYSPTGLWTVMIPVVQPGVVLNIDAVTAIRFEFQLDYKKKGTSATTRIFGNDLEQGFSALCPSKDSSLKDPSFPELGLPLASSIRGDRTSIPRGVSIPTV